MDKVDNFHYKRFATQKKIIIKRGNNENNMNATFLDNAKSPKWKSLSTLSTKKFLKAEKSALYLA